MSTFRRARTCQSGLTLIELMIAITISLIVLAALTAMFVTSSRARDEITRSNQQIENGRYAMQVLGDELRLAGYWGGADTRDIVTTLPTIAPDACYLPALPLAANDVPADVALPDVTPNKLQNALVFHVQGYDEGDNPNDHCSSTGDFGADAGSLDGYKAGTDILVVRRVSTCVPGVAGCTDLLGNNNLYFQASYCTEEISQGKKYLLLTTAAATFNLHKRGANCATAGTLADRRRFITHIYYIDNGSFTNSQGDPIPTLVRRELRNGTFAGANNKVAIAEGIEEMEIEYGLDMNEDGIPDAAAFTSAPTDAQWPHVMAVRVYLLARATDRSPGYTDAKTYNLGAGNNVAPGGPYKRHVFETLVHLSNPAGLRQ